MSHAEISWSPEDLTSKQGIFDLFQRSNYTMGDVQPVEVNYIFKDTNGIIAGHTREIYQVVFEEAKSFQVWLLVADEEMRKVEWRKQINRQVAGSVGDYVLFYTEDFADFWVAIISDDAIEQVLLQPHKPTPRADRLIRDLLNRRPLLDPKGLSATIAQAKHEITAQKIADALLAADEAKLRDLFKRAGLSIPGANLIIPRPEAPLKNAVIEVNLTKTLESGQQWVLDELARIVGTFHRLTKVDLQFIVLVTKDGILYFSARGDLYQSLQYPKERNDLVQFLTTIIACIDIRAAFNGNTFEQQFGTNSPFFAKARYLMEKYLREHTEDVKVVREEWERYFGKVYQAGDIGEPLFVKHAYLSLLIKNVLFCKYLPGKVVEGAHSFVELGEYLKGRGVELFFNDFYAWANSIKDLQEDLFHALVGARYESDDIFRVIYQDMVSPTTRHALGEFYTPPELARLMVDEVYEFGKVVLDPACGSGTFLVEIVSKIKDSGKNKEEQLMAIANLYGFDVNPIAVLVSKANILLHLEMLQTESMSVNIFLTDSLFPIRKIEQKDFEWGTYELFIMGEEQEVTKKGATFIQGTVGELKINERFFRQPTSKDPTDYLKQFGEYLHFIDEVMAECFDVNIITSSFDQKYLNKWLNERIPNTPKTFRDNIHYVIAKLVGLNARKQNHIWLYILYNKMGARLIRNQVDLLLGNPPWIVLNGIYSEKYKEQVKDLARRLDIMMGGKYATHTEISSLFFNEGAKLYLKQGGKVFFIVTAGIVSGDQHAKFRRFKGFGNIFIWQFDEDIFRIHNICLGMVKIPQNLQDRLKIPSTFFKCNIENNIYLFEKQTSEIYAPYNIEEIKGEEDLVRRLIPREQRTELLPSGKSFYYDLFYQGASVVPRNLTFVRIISEEKDIIVIKPNMELQQKPPWTFVPYTSARIEREYIFDLVKSTELVPFKVLGTNKIFLPVERGDLQYHPDQIKPLAKSHFALLQKLYQENQKEGASVKDLWDRINYNKELSNTRQIRTLKIVFPAAGGMIKSALVKGSVIIDHKFYYFSTENEDEAYYLMGILNSQSITSDLKKKGATGHGGSLKNYHKKPLEYNIPKYSDKSKLHKIIAERAREFEKKVDKVISEWFSEELTKMERKNYRAAEKKNLSTKNNSMEEVTLKACTIQNRILTNLEQDFKELDELVLKLLITQEGE